MRLVVVHPDRQNLEDDVCDPVEAWAAEVARDGKEAALSIVHVAGHEAAIDALLYVVAGREQERDEAQRRADDLEFQLRGLEHVRLKDNEYLLNVRDRLRVAGAAMFDVLALGGCGHADPRHPTHEECAACQRRAKVMDGWDEAVVDLALGASQETVAVLFEGENREEG